MTLAAIISVTAAALLRAQDTDAGSLLEAITAIARLPGEPASVGAAGLTRGETRLVTIENRSAFETPTTGTYRLVLVAGLDSDTDSARVALDAVRWFKTSASDGDRARWEVSVLPLASPDEPATPFPPVDGFFNDPERPEARYVWRWVTYQVPDLVVEIRAGDALQIQRVGNDGSLTAALARPSTDSDLGAVDTMLVTAPRTDGAGARVMQAVLAQATPTRSALRGTIGRRLAREPIAVARLLADRYPGRPGMSYIPAVAWVHTLRLAELIDDPRLRQKVLREIRPWLSGEQPIAGDRVSFAGLAGTMVFGEVAKSPGEFREAAARLAREGVAIAAAESAPGTPVHGSGWSDDLFLGTIAAATTGDADGLAAAVRLITRYARQLQQPTGLFHHSPDAPTAWGRGNGFAARGLAETMSALSRDHPGARALLAIYQRQMRGLATHQGPDGMWTQVVDQPGSYRETSVTALTVTAMARGIRLGWLDDSYRSVVERAWRGVLAHVVADGTLVDVCISTGAGPTLRHYLDRPAVNGDDDRGGALVLGAALEIHALTSGQ